MTGEPIDPVTFRKAVEELFDKIASHEGIDLAKFKRGQDDAAPSPERRDELAEIDKRLGELRNEAELRLQGLMITEGLRVWTSGGDGQWRRANQGQLKAWLMSAGSQPCPFYLDREALKHLRPDRYALDPRDPSTGSGGGGSGKRGRPSNSSPYTVSDEPLIDEMEDLLQKGIAHSLHQASILVAHKAEPRNTQPESKARRLRERLKRRRSDGE